MRGRKRDIEETRIRALLKLALPAADAKIMAAELKVNEFKKELVAIRKQGKRLEALGKAFDIRCKEIETQIKNKLGHNFFYSIQQGVVRLGGYNNTPEQYADSALSNIIDSALVDLQLDCLGKKDDALKAAIDSFNTKPLAELAVKEAIERLK